MDKESESGLPETVASCFQKLWEGEMVRRYGSGLLNRTKEGKRGPMTPRKHPSSKCLFQQTPYLNACSLCPVSPSLFFFIVCLFLSIHPLPLVFALSCPGHVPLFTLFSSCNRNRQRTESSTYSLNYG